ncbi:hypothetical protein Dda_7617 [Drechslerella dactyloides]|uniref:Uncharacterized protein n=1 Tax=Drechslerella dactyloides TaxID=74499 RepID=A0AAD6NIH3_DREDA|nr:hypothetical protein Dda_7617 [Drechslerella dactyloides]
MADRRGRDGRGRMGEILVARGSGLSREEWSNPAGRSGEGLAASRMTKPAVTATAPGETERMRLGKPEEARSRKLKSLPQWTGLRKDRRGKMLDAGQ